MADKSLIQLSKRTAKVTNLNVKPERHGDELEKRVDVSLEIVVNDAEIGMLVRTRWDDAAKVLWDDKGHPQFLDIEELYVDRVIEGECVLGIHNHEETLTFEGATLKKIRMRPLLGRSASLAFQVRIDPTGCSEELLDMQADERCVFAFAAAEEEAKAGNEKQQALV